MQKKLFLRNSLKNVCSILKIGLPPLPFRLCKWCQVGHHNPLKEKAEDENQKRASGGDRQQQGALWKSERNTLISGRMTEQVRTRGWPPSQLFYSLLPWGCEILKLPISPERRRSCELRKFRNREKEDWLKLSFVGVEKGTFGCEFSWIVLNEVECLHNQGICQSCVRPAHMQTIPRKPVCNVVLVQTFFSLQYPPVLPTA